MNAGVDLGCIEDWTVAHALRDRASRTPDAVFLQSADRGADLSYGDAFIEATAIARALCGLGIGRGDRVAIMAPNSVQCVVIWLGIALSGAADVWINPMLRGSSLAHVISTAHPRLIFASRSVLAALHAVDAMFDAGPGIVVVDDTDQNSSACTLASFSTLADGEPDGPRFHDLASIIYTSGTTGPPKGAMLPHAQAFLEAMTTVRQFDLSGEDVFYCCHPLFHIAGKYMATLSCIVAGAQMVLKERFDAMVWLDDIRRHRVTATISHGPMTELVFQTPPRSDDRDNPLQRMSSAPIPAGIADRFVERFDVHVMELWGMTEVDNPIWQPKDEPHRIGSCGKVCDEFFDVRIADPVTDLAVPTGAVGEILVRAKLPFTIFQGYVNAPEQTAAAFRNGWFHSGDFARVDAEGYVYFVDRSSERIRRRAENVSSYEIEMAAQRHPSVALAAAVGVPSGLSDDEEVKLCVVLREGMALDHVELTAALLEDLPPAFVPRYIEILSEFPRSSSTGKIQKSALKYLGHGRIWDRREAGIGLRSLSGPEVVQ
ncbi:AMP-binding protein [Mycolicibacterium sp.]|uniref:AMP-binding protein n=1 Tax=Mycolicibacterium sp. TaxID=2320850 RepID=UPI003D0EEEFF